MNRAERRRERSMRGGNEHKPPLEQFLERPLVRATLRLLNRCFAVAIGFVTYWYARTVFGALWLVRWPLNNKWKSAKFLWASFFRLATLASVSYLVFDRLYETEATITSPASDPKNPFAFPFAITNSSHLFAIHDVRWTCEIESLKVGNVSLQRVGELHGSGGTIGPGQSINLQCQGASPISHFVRTEKEMPVKEAEIRIAVEYKSRIFSMGDWVRRPSAKFTWYPMASNPQWIKGEIAE
jgi:hypothetical protein